MDNRPIGFFDSGLGGLTCLPTFLKELPEERIIYFGDTARTPYGSKSPETIEKFALQISDYLVDHDVKMIVVACNTISATCIDSLRKRHPDIDIIGIIEPVADKVSGEENSNVEVGVIGTKVTIESDTYANIISKRNKNVKIFSKSCPLFVPIIEEGLYDSAIMDLTIKHYLDDFIRENHLKKLVLGCTHYPIIAESIERIYPDLQLLSSSEEVVYRIKELLEKNGLCAENNTLEHHFYASDLSDIFVNMVEHIFAKYDDVKISLESKRFDSKEEL